MTSRTPSERTRRTLGMTGLLVGLLAVAVTTVVVAAEWTHDTSSAVSIAGSQPQSQPQSQSQSQSQTVDHDGTTSTGVVQPGEADGWIAPGTAVDVDADVAAIRSLDPALRDALQRAAADAYARDGVRILVSSGWRSDSYQRFLFDQAVTEHGEVGARTLVQTPEGSRHTKGAAVDIAFTDADDWLDRHGADHGLCRVYANEIWHFELLTSPGGTCPAMLTDATAG